MKILFSILLAATPAAAAAQSSGPINTPQLNKSYFFVGTSPYTTTIQSAVTASCNATSHKGTVVIPLGVTPSDTPTAATGCTNVKIQVDAILGNQCYTWGASGPYVAASCVAGSSGGITQLTGDVLAGPGSGAVASTLAHIPATVLEAAIAAAPYNITIATSGGFGVGHGTALVVGNITTNGVINTAQSWAIDSGGNLLGLSSVGGVTAAIASADGSATFAHGTAAISASGKLTAVGGDFGANRVVNIANATTSTDAVAFGQIGTKQINTISSPLSFTTGTLSCPTCVVGTTGSSYNGAIPATVGGTIGTQIASNVALSSALTASGYEELYTSNGNSFFIPNCVYVGATNTGCGALGSGYIFASSVATGGGGLGAGMYVRDSFNETSYFAGLNDVWVANNVAAEHSVFMGVTSAASGGSSNSGWEADSAHLYTEQGNINLHIAGKSVDIRSGDASTAANAGICIGCTSANSVSFPSVTTSSSSTQAFCPSGTSGAMGLCAIGGTVTDGAGTTTAGQIAISTTTGHIIAYTTTPSISTMVVTANGAASTPALSLTGTPFIGTGTTAVPLVYVNNGTAPTTWAAAGNYYGANAASGYAGDFFAFHVNGGAAVARLDNGGNLFVASCTGCGGGGITFPQTVAGTVNSGGLVYASSGTQISVSAAGTATHLVLWGGAGSAPTNSTVTDNGSALNAGSENIVSTGQGQLHSILINGTFAWGSNGLITTSALVATGTKFTTSGCSVSATTGGSTAGTFTLGANTCSVVLTLGGVASTTGWGCYAQDITSSTVTFLQQTASATGTATFAVPAGAGATDVIKFGCLGY